MLFNSYQFILLFLPIVFFVYFYLNSKRLTEVGKYFLVFSSLFFYSWWNVGYLFLIIISMIFNYSVGSALGRRVLILGFGERVRKSFLIVGVISNISLLVYFKYSDFLIVNINFLIGNNIELLNLALPLAISFFTFQQIAYLVDSYRGETTEYNFLNYALFVTFFPQLIAGPIVHHKEMMPQFSRKQTKIINYRNIVSGIFIFSIGLFKKVVIADSFAVYATSGFDIATSLNLFEAWISSLSYTFQLYFDFSGYTDMAVGLALLFNIRLPLNFNSPYKATNIQDFWRRWHVTLSRFLRDYVYIPLGGSRVSSYRIYFNLMTTFILGGIWHGAGWTFIFWGALHGGALVVHRLWCELGIRLWAWLAWLITINFINIAWIFFRAREWGDAVKVLNAMFSLDDICLPSSLFFLFKFMPEYGVKFGDWLSAIDGDKITVLMILLGFSLVLLFSNSMQQLNNLKINYKSSIYSVIMFIVSFFMINDNSIFLYFNF